MPKKAICACVATCSLISSYSYAKIESYNDLEFGFDRITYHENLPDVAGQGKLKQKVSVTNPTLRNFSFSEISDSWGLIIAGSSTLATDLAQERWSIGNFGVVQDNEFKIKHVEVEIGTAYLLAPRVQLIVGGSFTTSSFTRANFEKVQPGADRFSAAISPTAFDVAIGAVNEDQYSFLAITALRYDTQLSPKVHEWSYYAQLGMNVPVYVAVQNTSIPKDTLTESFNGWGVNAGAGLRYQLGKGLSLKLGVHGQYSTRNEIITASGSNRLRVPDITLTSVGLGTGILWVY